MPAICVIGGSRYFGKLLVERLRADGHQVTVLNRGSSPPPRGVEHLVADRDDEASLSRAIGPRTFDTVIDQVCYTPAQAAVAARVFRGRTRRYVMTSTIEVYDPATAALPAREGTVPVTEASVDPVLWPVRMELPWREPEFSEARYAEGKRQAEAVLARDGEFGFVSVRSAHVLGGGALEFTGRLAYYVERVQCGQAIPVHRQPLPTVFIEHREMADVLLWAATATDFTGPVNACSDGLLDVRELAGAIGARIGREPVYRVVADGEEASPFSFDRFYAMSNSRAASLGYRFSRTSEWLPAAVAEALAQPLPAP